MTLEIIYRGATTVPVEVEGITPDTVAGKSADDVSRLPIYCGNEQLPLGELFSVSGDSADGCMHWSGDLAGVHWIGAKMVSGSVIVAGDAGRHVGSEMSGGEIRVEGIAGDWVGGEMRGGVIRVAGKAGHLIGAAYRGSARGMTGGTILIRGGAGNEIGHTMRRGLIAIGGRSRRCGWLQHAGRHDSPVRPEWYPPRRGNAPRDVGAVRRQVPRLVTHLPPCLSLPPRHPGTDFSLPAPLGFPRTRRHSGRRVRTPSTAICWKAAAARF